MINRGNSRRAMFGMLLLVSLTPLEASARVYCINADKTGFTGSSPSVVERFVAQKIAANDPQASFEGPCDVYAYITGGTVLSNGTPFAGYFGTVWRWTAKGEPNISIDRGHTAADGIGQLLTDSIRQSVSTIRASW